MQQLATITSKRQFTIPKGAIKVEPVFNLIYAKENKAISLATFNQKLLTKLKNL